MKNITNTFLQFDFKTDGSNMGPLLFSNPIEVITTSDPGEVHQCLSKVETYVDSGYYAAGYTSYEIVYALQDETYSEFRQTMPLLWFGIFKEPAAANPPSVQAEYSIGKWEMAETKEHYEDTFNQIMTAIKQGRTKEINYTVSFKAPFTGDSYTYYQQLKAAQKSAYCAYLSIDGFDILSASPELFFELNHHHITVRPMKGTIGRGLSYDEDIQHKTWLANSEKNKFENKLTTDLMKNELKKTALPESIKVFDAYRVEKYPTVYQMTSGISGETIPDVSVMDIFKALYPCGSIAGVPKESGIKMIHDLEQRPREVYCGAIGYITPDNQAVFNVPIRTVWIDKQNQLAHYGAGGAITENSVVDEEYKEVLTKTEILKIKQPDFSLLETIGLHDGELLVINEHLERLKKSADYFDIPLDIQAAAKELQYIQTKHASGNWRVRLTVDEKGQLATTAATLSLDNKMKPVRISDQPIDKHNPFLYHKTTYRQLYDDHKKKNETCFDVLLWNKDREITEFTIGNFVAEINGELFTPPISCGVLPGTLRAHLIHKKIIKERKILLEELNTCTNLWLINSVRGWIKVEIAN